jgi:hypothetical protein
VSGGHGGLTGVEYLRNSVGVPEFWTPCVERLCWNSGFPAAWLIMRYLNISGLLDMFGGWVLHDGRLAEGERKAGRCGCAAPVGWSLRFWVCVTYSCTASLCDSKKGFSARIADILTRVHDGDAVRGRVRS